MDWTIHIGIVVRNVADLIGLVTRFESGGRKDAVLRSTDGDEIAIEWEWSSVLGKANELEKLKKHKVRPKGKERLKYAVLITYTHTYNIDKVYERVLSEWKEAPWPLLLILIDVIDVPKRKITSGKDFQNIRMCVFDKNEHRKLRIAPAFLWKVSGTRWDEERE